MSNENDYYEYHESKEYLMQKDETYESDVCEEWNFDEFMINKKIEMIDIINKANTFAEKHDLEPSFERGRHMAIAYLALHWDDEMLEKAVVDKWNELSII